MIKPKKTLANIKPYLIDRYYQDVDLKLDSNENSYGPSPVVIETLRNLSPDKIKFYPAYGELIDKLSKHFNHNSDGILLTNGCDEAINSIFSAYLEEGDKVLSFSPTFSMPKLYCDCIGAIFEEVPYHNDFYFDYDYFVQNITDDVKILYMTSPNNPTGEVIPPETIQKLLSNFKERLVVLDCTYFNYSKEDEKKYYSLFKDYNNLVILRSFSKDFALAGLRLGCIFAHPSIISEVRNVISPYSVNAYALHAGIAALSDLNYFYENKKKFMRSKEIITDALSSLGFKVYQTETNFILCNFGEYADFYYQKLLSKNIKVKYFKNVPFLENTFRITLPRLEDTERFLSCFSFRPLFVFDMDGVIFDVQNSYREAIKMTFEHYLGYKPSDVAIQEVKNLGRMCNDWDVTHFLIKQGGCEADYNEMVDIFQNLFFKEDRKPSCGLIDREVCVLDENFFKELSKYADCALFTMRPKNEALYSLERSKIKKYFSYIVTSDDVEGHFKPDPFGLNLIKKKCKYSKVLYFGDTVDDVKAGVDANVLAYGVIPPNASSVDDTEKRLFESGAKGVVKSPDNIIKLACEEVYANG